MKHVLLFSVLLVFYLLAGDAQARPESMESTDMPTTTASGIGPENGTEDDSGEDGASSEEEPTSQDSEEDDVHVQPKTSKLCPARNSILADIEAKCLTEYRAMKRAKANTTGTTDGMEKKMSGMAENSTESSTNFTRRHGHMHHRKRSCPYYRCILKKMDVVDNMDMPNEDLLHAWVAYNVTNEEQKVVLEPRITLCFAELKEKGLLTGAADSSKSEEHERDTGAGKMSCSVHQKLMQCLSTDTECPTFNHP